MGIVIQDFLKGGLKIVNIANFIASLKYSWIKKLTQCHKPWMDNFNAINGIEFEKNLIDFGNVFF